MPLACRGHWESPVGAKVSMEEEYNGVRVKVVRVLATTSGSHDVMGKSLGSLSGMDFCHLLYIWTLSFFGNCGNLINFSNPQFFHL